MTSEETIQKIQNIKNKLENININYDQTDLKGITMSFGIRFISEIDKLDFPSSNDISELSQTLFSDSDDALYYSKKNGKNKISICQMNLCNQKTFMSLIS